MSEAHVEVRKMLARLGLEELEEVFKIQELSLTDIAQLDHEAFKSIGISSVKHRTALIRYISGKSQNKAYNSPFLNLYKYFRRQHPNRGAKD